ncbi:MAG: hypothetical protein JXL80_08645, partial [Planctomycetes bacterium]|nr:hypothetical protein [Planctomycetota bacterium]
PEDMQTAEAVQVWIRRLRKLPEKVDVVDSWTQVEEVLFEGKRYPASQAIEGLSRLADQRAREAAAQSSANGNGAATTSDGTSGEAKP